MQSHLKLQPITFQNILFKAIYSLIVFGILFLKFEQRFL